jgi:hypothetical protein
MKFFTGGAMAVSPDGHWMVFPATGEDGVARYWVRSLETVEARPVPGTETAYVPAAWSGDSRFVLFTTNTKLQKVDIQGGPAQLVAELPSQLNGATWNKDGVIVVGVAPNTSNPLFRVPARGGIAMPVTALAKGEIRHVFPQFLPDGRHFLYLRVSNDPNQMGIYIGSIDVKPEQQSLKRLLATNREAYYAAAPAGGTGHLIFLRDTTLMAQPFDPRRMELSGEPTPIAEGVDSFSGANYGLFSVSDTGALVYRGGAGSTKLALSGLTRAATRWAPWAIRASTRIPPCRPTECAWLPRSVRTERGISGSWTRCAAHPRGLPSILPTMTTRSGRRMERASRFLLREADNPRCT